MPHDGLFAWFGTPDIADATLVCGKCAFLSEMTRALKAPACASQADFATTAAAYRPRRLTEPRPTVCWRRRRGTGWSAGARG